MPNKDENKILKQAKRSAVLDASVNVEERRVSLCFMTEKTCDNWWIPEVCLCDRENADLTRFENGIAPVLFNHDRDVIIGKIDKITFENQRANAEIVFDTDEKSEAVFKKVQSGSLRGVSVGYIRKNTTRVDASNDQPIVFMGRSYTECTDVTTLWELLEISIVSVPADNDTGVGRELTDDNSIEVKALLPKENNINEKEKSKMGEENKNTPVPDVEQERQAAIKAERERTQSIMDMCRKFNIEAEKQEKFINDGMTVEQARSAVMDVLAERQKPAQVSFGQDENEKVRSAIATALGVKYGVVARDAKEAEGTSKYANLSLRGIAEECLEREGVRGMRFESADNVFFRAIGSGAFLGIVDDFANKVKLSAYAEQPFIWKNFVSIGQNSDFKPNYKYEMGLDGLPYEMAHESAEFKYQEMGDARVSTMISTYGKAIRLTREIFINDALGQVKDAIAMQAGGFARLKEIKFFETLTKAVKFNAANKNIATAKGITADVYDEMAQLMMAQKDVNGEGFIGVAPAFILAPTNQRMAHKVLLNSSAKVDQANAGVINPVAGDYELFVSPYLTGNDYYALARPNQMRGIEYTTLRGNDSVQSRTVVPNAYLGIEYQMWDDWGFNVLSNKFAVKASKQ